MTGQPGLRCRGKGSGRMANTLALYVGSTKPNCTKTVTIVLPWTICPMRSTLWKTTGRMFASSQRPLSWYTSRCEVCNVVLPLELKPEAPEAPSVKEVLISDSRLQRLVTRNLVYNKKLRGRVLTTSLPELGLCKGSRLEPTSQLADVASFEYVATPFKACFWVGPEDARLTHMCPLFRLHGVTLDTWAIDIMHAWHLGPLQQLVSLSLHFCMDCGLWAPRTTQLAAADRKEMSLLAIKAELFQFYKEIRNTDPEWRQKGTEATWNHMERFSSGTLL